MRGAVAYFQFVLSHSQVDNPGYEKANETRGDHVPYRDESCSDELVRHLPESLAGLPLDNAIQQACVITFWAIKQPQEIGFRKQPREDPPQNSCHCMRVEDGQRVVHLLEESRSSVEYHHGVPWY